MAAIEGFTEAQNSSLAQVEVGNLILVNQIFEQFDDESESDPDGDNESNDGSDEDGGDDDDEQPDSEDEDSSSESESEPDDDSEHAEHIEDVSRADSASPNNIEYRTLRAANGSDHDDTEEHLVTVYLVVKVTKNAKGAVDDLSLVPLRYNDKADVSPGTFQLYGKQCVPSFYTGGTADNTSELEKEFISIRNLPGGHTLRFTASPQGDYVRNVVLYGECPACIEGWLDGISRLDGMVKGYTIPSSLANEPTVCPSCIGIELMKKHQDLRAELEAFSRVSDFGAIVAFHGRLAARRRELDYEFYQFDERKWGYLFDDMVSDDDEDGDDSDRYEVWDEATDPSNGAILHPASDATIKSLPIKTYAEVKTEDDANCVVCREEFKDEQLIMQLPCKHYFCEDGCTVQWLKQHDTCPICRARVPPVVENDGKKAVHKDVNQLDTDVGAEQEQEDAAPIQAVSIDRDDDVTMVDAW